MRGQESRLLGRWGETLAAQYLRERGYIVEKANWHCPFGELDLVASTREYLCFVEVKLRKNSTFGCGADYVTPKKQQRIQTTAQLYLQLYPTEKQPRFDVIEISAPQGIQSKYPEIRHLQGVF